MIALDGSSELTSSDFNKLKELAKNIIDKYSISKHGTHMGIIEYSDEINVKVPLGTTHDATQLKRLVDNIAPSQGTQRFTARALKKVAKQVFPVSFGGRLGAQRVLIIITAGPTSDTSNIDKAVEETKKAGVNVFLVTIKDSEDDAGKIVPDDNVVLVKTIDDLPSAADQLDKTIKDSIENSKFIVHQFWITLRPSGCRAIIFPMTTHPWTTVYGRLNMQFIQFNNSYQLQIVIGITIQTTLDSCKLFGWRQWQVTPMLVATSFFAATRVAWRTRCIAEWRSLGPWGC